MNSQMHVASEQDKSDWKISDLNYEVPAHAQRFGYMIGGITVTGFVLLFLTGIIMAYFYEPSVNAAHQRVLALSGNSWGLWLRSFHRWVAEAVIFLIVLHLTRVILTGSYYGRRRANWWYGVILLFITVGFFYTGTVIKWDQEGYEAFQHSLETMELLPGGAALVSFLKGSLEVMRMFATHVLVLPLLLILFLTPHLVLVKLNKLSPLPGREREGKSTFFAHLRKIGLFSLSIYGFLAFLAAQFPAVVYPGPYAGVEMTKPPWPFLTLYMLEDWIGIKALLIAPLIILIGLIILPYIDKKGNPNATIHKVVVWSYLAVVAMLIFFIIMVGITPPVKHI